MNTIERLKELEAKATPGPWAVAIESGVPFVMTADYSKDINLCSDLDLIVEMRNVLPKFLALVDASRLAEQHLNAYQMKETGLTDALAAFERDDDKSPACDACGHDSFREQRYPGEVEPQYICQKCGHVHFI